MRRLAIFSILALAGCQQSDPAFGTSYDACVLRNHANGSDEATDICQRHFMRKPTDDEVANVAFNSSLAVKGPDAAELVGEVVNKSDDLIIKEVHIEAKVESQTQGQKAWSVLDWTYPMSVEPGEQSDLDIPFDGSKATQPYTMVSHKITATKVISHTGKTDALDHKTYPPLQIAPSPPAKP